jgi:hypothetical protein
MKRRTAAARAGWYVMVPWIPRQESESTRGRMHYIGFRLRFDPKAPLSKWSVLHKASSRQSCQAFLKKFKSEANANKIEKDPDRKREKAMALKLAAHAKCFAGDDPQLKRNEQVRFFELRRDAGH